MQKTPKHRGFVCLLSRHGTESLFVDRGVKCEEGFFFVVCCPWLHYCYLVSTSVRGRAWLHHTLVRYAELWTGALQDCFFAQDTQSIDESTSMC
jgi:hypothetical protein